MVCHFKGTYYYKFLSILLYDKHHNVDRFWFRNDVDDKFHRVQKHDSDILVSIWSNESCAIFYYFEREYGGFYRSKDDMKLLDTMSLLSHCEPLTRLRLYQYCRNGWMTRRREPCSKDTFLKPCYCTFAISANHMYLICSITVCLIRPS